MTDTQANDGPQAYCACVLAVSDSLPAHGCKGTRRGSSHTHSKRLFLSITVLLLKSPPP